MSIGKYILVNGTFVPTDDYRISLPDSNALLFTEKIRAVRTALPFFDETLELIKLKLLIFNLSFPDFTDNNGAGLKRQLERSLTKNKFFLGAILTLTFRLVNQNIQYSIVTEKTETIDFELNEKGLYVGVFDKIQKSESSLSNLSLGSEAFWNIARNHLRNAMVDQFFLVNTEDELIEAPESNIYIISGDRVKGANCSRGAYLDISQPCVLEIFDILKLKYSEEEAITIQDLREAEEIMTVNAIDGIKWMVGFEGKRYFNNTIRKISELFNRNLSVE
jgi:branched-subunit amino acid aminotransferase/4-amino-4-deoxychorismate lyase